MSLCLVGVVCIALLVVDIPAEEHDPLFNSAFPLTPASLLTRKVHQAFTGITIMHVVMFGVAVCNQRAVTQTFAS